MKKILFSSLLFSILFCFGNCNLNAQQNSVVENIDAEKFKELISKGDGILLDVRTPEETAQGHLKGAVFINYNDENFETQLNKLEKDKTVFVYCRSGRRSANAAELMQKNGFKEVYNLIGGIIAWGEKGFEIVKPESK